VPERLDQDPLVLTTGVREGARIDDGRRCGVGGASRTSPALCGFTTFGTMQNPYSGARAATPSTDRGA